MKQFNRKIGHLKGKHKHFAVKMMQVHNLFIGAHFAVANTMCR